MQDINIQITKKILKEGPTLYEISMPVIKIGNLLYIRDILNDDVNLIDKDTIIKTFISQEEQSEIETIEDIKILIQRHYPPEVRNRIVFKVV